MQSPRETAKRRILLKIEGLNILIEQLELRSEIILFQIELIVINCPVSDDHDKEIREKLRTVKNIQSRVRGIQYDIETLYEQLYQVLRLLH